MKTSHLLLFASVFGLFAAAGTVRAAAPASSQPSPIEVNFSTPEKFTDVKDDVIGSDKGRENILLEIREYIQKQTAKNYLPEGYKLVVTFTEIDLAGDFEPWRTGASEVRIVRSNYPPRMDLSYQLTAPNGAVVKKEGQKLRNMTFDTLVTLDRSDPLLYEKEMLNEWMKTEFGALKKK